MGIISFWNEWKQRNGKKPPELIYRCTSKFAECNILQMHLTIPPQSSSFHVLSTIWIQTFLDDEAATAITSDVSWVKISLALTNTFLLSWVGWFHLNISISIPLHMVRMFIRIHLNWLVSYYRRTPALFDFAFAHSVRFLCFCYKCSVVCFLFLFNYDQFQIICRHTPNRYVSIDKIHMVFLWRLFCFEESVHFSFMFELIPWLKRANEPKISGTFVDIDFLSQPLRENIHFYVILIWNRYKEMRSKIWKIMTQYSHHPDKIKQKLHWISSLDAFHAM